ncbi:MAG TPA: FAD-binding oxidoreductase [Methylomirabilota bacterium]
MTLPRTSSAVIVGGGVVGCAIAYHLARRGMRDVVVLERETVGSGTTSKAAGGIRAQFSTETEIRFSLEAIAVFERFEEEFGVDPGYVKIGYLFLVSDPADLRGFETRIALQRRLGVDVRVITPEEARKLVPALRVDDLIAAVWGPGDGLAGPAEVTSGFARGARRLGVRILEGAQVTGITRERDAVTGVTTTVGSVSAPVVINAAGPSAARIGRMAGVDVAVHPRRRHIFFTEPFPEIPGPVPLTTDRRSGFYFRKEMEQVLLSPGDVEDIGTDFEVPMDPAMMADAVEKAVDRVPVLEHARIAGGWAGLRPLTPDDHAIIGWAPGVTGFFLAVGFGGHGFQHSPATGRHVADWIVDGTPSMDLSLFDPARFADGRPGDGGPGDGRPGDGRPGNAAAPVSLSPPTPDGDTALRYRNPDAE